VAYKKGETYVHKTCNATRS